VTIFIYVWPIVGFVLPQFARTWRHWFVALVICVVSLLLSLFVLPMISGLTVGSTAPLLVGGYGGVWGLLTQALVLRSNGRKAGLIRAAGLLCMIVLTALVLLALYF
jgi:hypothetical protein